MSIFNLFKKKLDSPISAKQKQLVQETFSQVAPIAITAADIFYNKLFELDPSLKPLFTGDITKQGEKLMTMLAAAVKGLDDLPGLIPVVQSLGKRHVGYGVQDEHYDTVAAALLFTLEQGLGEAWNDDVKDAWVAVYTVLANVMKETANEKAA